MSSAPLPPHLIAALQRGVSDDEVWRLVTQLELYGLTVVVNRLQLGNYKAPGFGQSREIYRTATESVRNQKNEG